MTNRISARHAVANVSLITTLLLITATVASGLFLASSLTENVEAAAPAPQATIGDVEIVAAYEETLVDIYQTNLPSVVSIRVTKLDRQTSQPFGLTIPEPDSEAPESFLNRGQGSGFVWDKMGHIVTNFHVIADATDIEVEFASGKTVKAELLGGDPNADLAVLKVNVPARELSPVSLGDSDYLQPGRLAIAIGAPFGQEFTMTSGIISAVGRTIPSGNAPFSIPEVIQTDAPINPGNSGGPLLNRQGEVIGINTQILSRSGSSAGIGFAVPVNIAKDVVPTLIAGKIFEYSWLGVSGQTIDADLAEILDLPGDTTGVLVIAVVEDGPADAAGLQGSDVSRLDGEEDQLLRGDIITAIGGQTVTSMDDLITYLLVDTRPGDEVDVDVIRADGQQETIKVTLGVRPGADTIN